MIKRCKIGCLTDRVARTFVALQKQQALSAVINYIKTSVFHIAFEVVITILYISPQVLYSSAQSDIECIALSLFFRSIMQKCALIFSIVVFIYTLILYFVVAFCHRKYEMGEENEGIDFIKRKSKTAIVLGVLAYIILGLAVGLFPSWFTGIEIGKLSTMEQGFIIIRIIIAGNFWAVLSYIRLQRIIAFLGKKTSDEIMKARLNNIVAQGIAICCAAICLVLSFQKIPIFLPEFELYNLILIVYVGIISAYASISYNLEVKGKYPNE